MCSRETEDFVVRGSQQRCLFSDLTKGQTGEGSDGKAHGCVVGKTRSNCNVRENLQDQIRWARLESAVDVVVDIRQGGVAASVARKSLTGVSPVKRLSCRGRKHSLPTHLR